MRQALALPLILILRLCDLPVIPTKLCLPSSSLFIFQLKKVTAPWLELHQVSGNLWPFLG